MKTLDISKKEKISYCIPLELRDEQIKININKVKGRIEPHDLRNESIALVSYGPSLNDTWQELKKFKYIITCSGAHKFLIEKGIIPTWHADLDPRDYKIKILGEPHKDVEYLIASTIHPNYLDALKGHKVKLWHIFANDDDAKMILPKGEWCLTGGSSIGLRLMTLARFMGFTDFHIFGMDGSFGKSGTHTTKHPNAPPANKFETEYKGKKYLTTPSILYVAKETFHELDQMSDVKATFYGDGLVQAMAKDYVPNHKHNTLIAFNSPELISKEYTELNYKLHQDNPGYGMGGAKHAKTILELSKANKTTSILDYGCGKGMLAKELPFPIWEYDPAIPEKNSNPKPADIVVCTDVLEHIEMDKLTFVLDDLRRCVKQIGYFVISTRKAVKTYANGANTHSIVQGKDWWNKKLNKFFDIGTIIEKEKECELHVVVAPKKIIQPDIITIEKDGLNYKFYTPNDVTKWRAETLFTKEPSTIEWINQMEPGEILYDIGANIGSYSVVAGVKGIKIYSFEPEAENYALLVKNLILNNIEPNAYCMAISDEEKAGTLYASNSGAGGACHSFNEMVGPDLKARETKFTQGCFGYPLDKLVQNGLPLPQHLKIDVDGLEHKVINGANNILSNGLKSLLVEVNPSLPQHLEMLKTLDDLGFTFDKEQVKRATRKEGAFKGCAEYIFTKQNKIESHLINKIKTATLSTKPFKYIYIENIFPEDVYNDILKNMPSEYIEIEKTRGTKGYPKRFTATPTDEFWTKLNKQLLSGGLKKAICEKFNIKGDNLKEDLLLIRDNPGYTIPPHTDSINKIISALFYLPTDNSTTKEGTSIFTPIQKGFICKKGKHYNFEDFRKVYTAPFKQNSLFLFMRTDNSFHGVEPCENERNVLLYNINK